MQTMIQLLSKHIARAVQLTNEPQGLRERQLELIQTLRYSFTLQLEALGLRYREAPDFKTQVLIYE